MLDWVPYVPEDRNQGSCGNCWVWAGTGCLEVAHAVENDVVDRLSIQYFNSLYGGSSSQACCGGFITDFATAYNYGFAIPWDNFNADWQDGNRQCGNATNVNPSSIVISPRYHLGAVTAVGIATHPPVVEQVAINTIKWVLQQGHPVYFAFYLPDNSAWTAFQDFWDNDPEEEIWHSFFPGYDYNDGEGEGGGHAVLCVGYHDEENSDLNDYWIMLNSWGTADGNRPNGVFRVDMHLPYACYLNDLTSDYGEYSINWGYLEADFTNSAPHADGNGPYTGEEGTPILFDASGSSDPDGHALEYAWDFDNDGNWDTGWSTEPTTTHTWCDDRENFTVGLMVKEQSTAEQLTDTDLVWVTVNNVAPTADAGPNLMTVAEGDMFTFPGSFSDPAGTCDTYTIEWDFGDSSPTANSLSPDHIYGDNGVYTATLTVTDDDGGVGSDTVTVTVENVAPSIITDSMEQPNSEFILPVVHTLDFEARATDPGSDDLTYDWYWDDLTPNDTVIYYNNGSSPDPYSSPEVNPMDVTDTQSHVYAEPGDYTVMLTVTDDDGGSEAVSGVITIHSLEEAKHITNDYIQNLPDNCFKGKADQRRNTFDSLFFALDQMLAQENYTGMIQHLRNNMRDKADGLVDGKLGDDWIIDQEAQEHICQKIDDITAYLEYLLNN